MKKRKRPEPKILWVQIREALPNAMFTEQQRQSLRFLCYNHSIECAACGKKRRTMWTMTCQFKAVAFHDLAVKDFPMSLKPLTPVCPDHLLHPDWPQKSK